jgi:glutathione peroxidase
MEKIEVNGENTHKVYKYLRANAAELKGDKPGQYKPILWNFGKFLVDANGKVCKYNEPAQNPMLLEPLILNLLK